MFLMTQKMSALALLVAVSLSGCAAQQVATPAPAVQKTVTAPEKTSVLKRELADGLYEMVLNQKGDALFVASSEGFKDVQGGVVYKLDPATLKTIGRSHTDLKNFAMAIAPDGQTVYVTNSLDGGISAISTADGKVKKRLMFTERNKEGFPFGAREILLHDGSLFVGGVGDPGVIWVIDAETLKLKKPSKMPASGLPGCCGLNRQTACMQPTAAARSSSSIRTPTKSKHAGSRWAASQHCC
jgi:sugar lactone lactonase YvrE